jgi:hypothetical protein
MYIFYLIDSKKARPLLLCCMAAAPSELYVGV